MNFCKNCLLTPICSYKDYDYDRTMPEKVFTVVCEFRQESDEVEPEAEPEAETEPEAVDPEEETADETAERVAEEIAEAKAEPEKDTYDLITETKYPAKKKGRPKKILTEKDKDEIMKLYDMMKPEAIAERMGISQTNVFAVIRERLNLSE